MFLHRLKLKNLLSFGPEGQELELGHLNVLIGPNGSGKSNLIETIGLLKACPDNLHETILSGGGVANWVWRGDTRASLAEIEADICVEANRLLSYQLCFSAADKRFQVKGESLSEVNRDREPTTIFETDGHTTYLLSKGTPTLILKEFFKGAQTMPDQSIFATIKGTDYPEITSTGAQLRRIRLYREWALGRTSPYRFPAQSDLPDNELSENGENLGLVFNRFKRDSPKCADRILEEMCSLYEEIEAIEVVIEGGTVQLFLREGDTTHPATSLSNGTLRYLCLLVILCHPNPPPLICLEEPELGLHPDLLPGLVDLLREASNKSQLIVTTHSDVLVDKFTDTPDCVVVCERQDQQSQLRRLISDDLKDWLSRYSLGELWTRGELGGNRW